MGRGNTGPVAEFNIQIDPEAAAAVLGSGARVSMVPLDVTHTVLATERVLARLLAGDAPSPFRRAVHGLLLFFAGTYRDVFGFTEGPPLHDPVAVALALAPGLFRTELLRVDVECASPLSYGQTVCDVWRQSGRAPNCAVATKVDVDAFFEARERF